MSIRPTPPTLSFPNDAGQLSEDIKAFIRNELEDQLGDFLNVIDDLLNKQTAILRSTIQSLMDDSEDQWRLNKGPISKGKFCHYMTTLQLIFLQAMKRYYLMNFPGPLAPSAQEKKRGFLAEVGEFKATGGSPYESARREWTKNLYLASFQPLSLVCTQSCLIYQLTRKQNDSDKEQLKTKVDKHFRVAFQNFRSSITGNSKESGVGKAQVSMIEALKTFSTSENLVSDIKEQIEHAIE
jgi:hypothetical protein